MIEKVFVSSSIFRYLDGLVTASVVYALHKKGVLSYLLDKKECTLNELTSLFEANEGRINFFISVLCPRGFLTHHVNNSNDEIKFSLTDKSEAAFSLFYLFEDVVDLLQFRCNSIPDYLKNRLLKD
jgi:hypothetical protein